MDQNQIIEIIKANQTLPYEEVKRQASEVGLSSHEFENAWRSAKLDPSLDHDARIAQIIMEMEALEKNSKSPEQWKDYFRSKGYLDDEVDIAYVLIDVKIKSNPFPSWHLPVIVVGLITLASVYLYPLPGIPILVQAVITALLAFGLFYFILFIIQFENYALKIINLDFNAISCPSLPEWKTKGSKLLDFPSAHIYNLFEMVYDGRQTFYGEYQYTVGSGKYKHTYYFSFIAQKAHKELPLVHLFAPRLDRTFLQKEIHLEGGEFNKVYNIYSENPQDAFYVFNPRVMAALLKPEAVKDLKSFETVGEYILMSFTHLSLNTPTGFKKPYVRFADYEKLKTKMLYRLDIASDINDTLSRLIVDSGEKRSKAKHK